jgi:hypothetical protein
VLIALYQMASTFHPPTYTEDISPDFGLILANIILLATIFWVVVLAINRWCLRAANILDPPAT